VVDCLAQPPALIAAAFVHCRLWVRSEEVNKSSVNSVRAPICRTLLTAACKTKKLSRDLLNIVFQFLNGFSVQKSKLLYKKCSSDKD